MLVVAAILLVAVAALGPQSVARPWLGGAAIGLLIGGATALVYRKRRR